MLLWISIAILPFLFLFAISILVNVVSKGNITYGIQKLRQFLAYFSEMNFFMILGVSLLTKYESGHFYFWKSEDTFFELFQRGLASYTVYQILIFVLLHLSAAADKDSLMAFKANLKHVILKMENSQDLTDIKKRLIYIQDNSMYSNNSKEENKVLIRVIDEYTNRDKTKVEDLLFYCKAKLIDINHRIEQLGLPWQSSFFLNLMK